ncbi:stage II sporulation protein M [Aeropyrum camini]|uniref:stage II sporulation protein M n=1 Tax=Aeropyrum camini TaxID=229980 RepID=UPI00078894F7|nr:stage II sporulation protein M [Aeropyrum camini]
MTRRRLPGLGIVLLGFSLGAVAFLAGVWVGYVKPDYTLLDPLSEKAGLILKLPPALRPLGIFINNLLAATLTYVLTILLILPGLSVVGLNGYIVGTALKYAVDVKDLNLTVALLLIIPHGVLEIPAFWRVSVLA